MNRLTPADFKFDLMEQAYALRRHAIARHKSGALLDRKTTMWVIRLEAWREFRSRADYLNHVSFAGYGLSLKNELFGLPVRITVDDEENTPMVQLVMEPWLEGR